MPSFTYHQEFIPASCPKHPRITNYSMLFFAGISSAWPPRTLFKLFGMPSIQMLKCPLSGTLLSPFRGLKGWDEGRWVEGSLENTLPHWGLFPIPHLPSSHLLSPLHSWVLGGSWISDKNSEVKSHGISSVCKGSKIHNPLIMKNNSNQKLSKREASNHASSKRAFGSKAQNSG